MYIMNKFDAKNRACYAGGRTGAERVGVRVKVDAGRFAAR